MVGQPLEHVADIDHHRAFGRLDREPLAVAVEQFEPGFLGAEQQSDQVDVLVRAGADSGRVRRRPADNGAGAAPNCRP